MERLDDRLLEIGGVRRDEHLRDLSVAEPRKLLLEGAVQRNGSDSLPEVVGGRVVREVALDDEMGPDTAESVAANAYARRSEMFQIAVAA
jgi:hypothetical protein